MKYVWQNKKHTEREAEKEAKREAKQNRVAKISKLIVKRRKKRTIKVDSDQTLLQLVKENDKTVLTI